uniref:Uncharacterized protein n=1 Tax=Arundo donax TaxID=35708 RepID=A0A0A9DL83_ARUDO
MRYSPSQPVIWQFIALKVVSSTREHQSHNYIIRKLDKNEA